MYESNALPPISRAQFVRRVLAHFAAVLVLVSSSVALGMAGYEHFEQLQWRDAFLNAAMLLGGMGPVDPPQTDAGKVFAGLYALYAGLVFIVSVSVLFAPVVHRVMHTFHWNDDA